MEEKAISWSNNPEDLNPFKDYNLISERKTDQGPIKVTTDGVEISEKQAGKLIDSVHKAAQIAHKINQGPIDAYQDEYNLRFSNKNKVIGLMEGLNTRQELLHQDDQSQTAAVVHELIHAIEEELEDPQYSRSYPQETVPLAAEFIFGGETRLPIFTRLTNQVINHLDNPQELSTHSRGWQQALPILEKATNTQIDLHSETADDIIEKLKQARDLKEEDKIALIQDLIKNPSSDQ